jgi:hypothetical protein
MNVETPWVDCLHLRQIRQNSINNVDGPINVGSTSLHNQSNFKTESEGPITMVDVTFLRKK